jgi:hypothetical protein
LEIHWFSRYKARAAGIFRDETNSSRKIVIRYRIHHPIIIADVPLRGVKIRIKGVLIDKTLTNIAPEVLSLMLLLGSNSTGPVPRNNVMRIESRENPRKEDSRFAENSSRT